MARKAVLRITNNVIPLARCSIAAYTCAFSAKDYSHQSVVPGVRRTNDTEDRKVSEDLSGRVILRIYSGIAVAAHWLATFHLVDLRKSKKRPQMVTSGLTASSRQPHVKPSKGLIKGPLIN